MRLDGLVQEDELRVLSSDKNTLGRAHLHAVLDRLAQRELEKLMKCTSISDVDFDKDIRTQRGVVKGIDLLKKLLTEIDKRYGE